jgi:hypothetical protein
MKGKTKSEVMNSEEFQKLSRDQQIEILDYYFPVVPAEKGRVANATGEHIDKSGNRSGSIKIEKPLVDLGTPIQKNIVEPIKNFGTFGAGNDSPVAQNRGSQNLPILKDLNPVMQNIASNVKDFAEPIIKAGQFEERVDSPVNIHAKTVQDPNKDQSFHKVTGLDTPENFIDPDTGRVSPFYAGTTNSIVSRLAGYKTYTLGDNPSLSDEVKFALGKMSLDLPVIGIVGMASGGLGLGGLATAAASFGAYEGLDRATDLSARGRQGMLAPGEESLNPVEEGFKAAPIGALKGGLGHIGGMAGIGAIRGLQTVAAKGGANALVAHKVASVMKPVAYNAVQNEVMGQITAAQHGSDYTMRNRLVDSITTAGVNVGASGGKRTLQIMKKNMPEITNKIQDGSNLDAYAETLAKKEIKSTADDAAKRYFKRGGTPEETARLTLEEIQKRSSSDAFGHPFKNPEDLQTYYKNVYEAAKNIDQMNSDPLNLNQKGAELTDGFPIHRLGEGLKKGKDKFQELEAKRGEERTLLEEYNSKIGRESPAEIERIKFQLEGVRQQQRVLYNDVHKKSRTELYGLMKKEAKAQDKMRDAELTAQYVDDMFKMPEQQYSENSVKRVLNLSKEQVFDMSMKSNLNKQGKIAQWYNSSFKGASRRLDQLLGAENSAMIKQALRGADAKRTQTIDRMYKAIESMRKNMTAAEERVATIHMIRKQMVRKKVKYEDGTKGEELVNVGEQKIQDMMEMGYLTPEELAASNQLNQNQLDFVSTSRAILDEIWTLTNKSRKIMDKETIEGLPDYFPLTNNLEAMSYMAKTQGYEIGWVGDNPLRKKQTPNDPKNLKKRLDVNSVVSLDGSRVLENYTRYMVNKAYMNPVAYKMYQLGKNINSIHSNDSGMDLIRHAKFISGDVDPVINKTVDSLLTKVARNVSQAMLVGNYSTYLTQLSALDGIVAECGYKSVNDTMKQLLSDPSQWAEIQRASSVLTARQGAGDITIVDLQNSLQAGFRKKIIEKGMYPIQALDMVAATIGWKAFYDKAIRNGMRVDDAKAYADDFVIKTQASSSRIDAPPVMRNALGKNLFTLQTFSLNRFDYMVSDLFGVQPVYKFMKLVEDEDTARALARENKWHYEPMAKGKKGYAIYDPVKAHNYMEATRKMARLLVAQSLFNMTYDAMEELTTFPLAKPNPDPVGAFIEKKYGTSITGHLMGKPQKNSTLSEAERDRRAGFAAFQEVSEMVPLASSLLKYSDSAAGAPLSKVINASRKAQYFAESGNVVTGLQSINDASALFGNPAHALVAKILQRYKNMEKEEEMEALYFKKKAQERKKLLNRGRESRPSARSNLKIER